MEFVRNFNVPLAWRNQYCGVFKIRHQGVVYYFLDNEYYFKRDNLYGYYDDAERFAFFSKAAMEMINYIDFDPDVVQVGPEGNIGCGGMLVGVEFGGSDL